MDNKRHSRMFLGLQFFAEGAGGGDGGTGAAGPTGDGASSANATAAVSQKKGVKTNPLASVVYGVQPTEKTEASTEASPAAEVNNESVPEDRTAKFDAMIKGEYKDLYDAKMQDTVKKRVKTMQDLLDKHAAYTPVIEMLAKKYGVDGGDVKALSKAIEDDDSYYEQEAIEKGVTVEHLKELRKLQKENAEFKREREKEAEDQRYDGWVDQSKALKEVYPAFDLDTELNNKQFSDLLRSNIDVRTAYEVVHKDDIIAAAMQFAVKTAEEKIANKIIANGSRPAENGNASQGATVAKSNVSQLTKADRAEVMRRVANGEKISFG